MVKIIVAAPPIPGEVSPLLEAARGLASHGHQVTVLTGSGFREAVEQAGLTFAPLTGAADYDVRRFAAQRAGAATAHLRRDRTLHQPDA
jgi:UDP:flavonoid glycosyltransferase YjiC (YdhE family)